MVSYKVCRWRSFGCNLRRPSSVEWLNCFLKRFQLFIQANSELNQNRNRTLRTWSICRQWTAAKFPAPVVKPTTRHRYLRWKSPGSHNRIWCTPSKRNQELPGRININHQTKFKRMLGKKSLSKICKVTVSVNYLPLSTPMTPHRPLHTPFFSELLWMDFAWETMHLGLPAWCAYCRICPDGNRLKVLPSSTPSRPVLLFWRYSTWRRRRNF